MAQQREENRENTNPVVERIQNYQNQNSELNDGNPLFPDGYLAHIEQQIQDRLSETGISISEAMQQIGSIVNQTLRVQQGHRLALENLAEEVIIEMYGPLIENVILDIQLCAPGEPSQQMEPGEPAPMEQIEDEETRNEIYKRRVSNYLTSGAAISTHRIVHMPGYRDRLNQISPDLVQQYDQLLKLNEILDGAIPIEEQERMWREIPEGMAGSVKVEWPQENEVEELNEIEQTEELAVQFEDENVEVDMPLREEERDVPNSGDPIIHARGIDFPMLVHETVKGVYELIMANGIPEDEELAQIVINNADTYMQELIGHRVGPQLRQDLLEYINQHEASNDYPNLLERVIGRIINLSGTEFLALTNGILNRTLVTKGYIDELIEEIIQELQDYSLYQQFGEDSDYEESFSEDETIESQSEPKTPTVSKSDVPITDLDYSNMSKIELQAEMDKVLDSENWVEAKIIGTYLKKFL